MKKLKVLITIILMIPMIVPINASAAQTTYGQFLDDLAKAEKELKDTQNSINK